MSGGLNKNISLLLVFLSIHKDTLYLTLLTKEHDTGITHRNTGSF